MSIWSKEALYKVIVVCRDRYFAFATAFLLLVLLAWHTLDVAAVSYGYDHIFIWYEIFDVDIIVVINDLSHSWYFKFIFDLKKLFFDQIFKQCLAL